MLRCREIGFMKHCLSGRFGQLEKKTHSAGPAARYIGCPEWERVGIGESKRSPNGSSMLLGSFQSVNWRSQASSRLCCLQSLCCDGIRTNSETASPNGSRKHREKRISWMQAIIFMVFKPVYGLNGNELRRPNPAEPEPNTKHEIRNPKQIRNPND